MIENPTSKFLIFFIILFFLTICILEIFYFLPSPTGDDLWFLKLAFNICRDDLFVATNPSVFNYNEIALNWTTHGWFSHYVIGKLNLNCSIRGLFILSFISKLLTSFLLYLICKEKKISNVYILIAIIFTLIVQLKLQFRPENFSILIYLLLYYCYTKNYKLLVGIFFSFLVFSQPTIGVIFALFSIILYYKFILINYFKLILGFTISTILILYIYPFTLNEFVIGLWEHRSANIGDHTFLTSGLNVKYLNNLVTYYIFTNFIPLFGILFFIIYFVILKKNLFFLLTFPIILFFGPNIPSANYVLIGITPFLIIIFFDFFEKKKINTYTLNYILILTLIISFLGSLQYLGRNVLTAANYSKKFYETKNFLIKNIDIIHTFPGFAFMLHEDFKFISNGQNNINENEKDYLIYAANGLSNPCKNKNVFPENKQNLSLFKRKIFNTNSGYGIWVCYK